MTNPQLNQLPALVRMKFKLAQENGDLTFYPTRVSIIHYKGFPFQIRYSPALAKKPIRQPPNEPSKPKLVDPFENPSGGLLIAELPLHNLVLNKFPVISDHFIISTKTFKEQTHLLELVDIGAAYECIIAYKDSGEELFAFFNSGEYSGASQPHRHIQFLPVESMRAGVPRSAGWSLLADKLVGGSFLPLIYFSTIIPVDSSHGELYTIYTSLYNDALALSQRLAPQAVINSTRLPDESVFSYNLGFTENAMILCPRVLESASFNDGNGQVSPNGSLLGGTILVKSESEWNALVDDESKLEGILRTIGIPNIIEQQL